MRLAGIHNLVAVFLSSDIHGNIGACASATSVDSRVIYSTVLDSPRHGAPAPLRAPRALKVESHYDPIRPDAIRCDVAPANTLNAQKQIGPDGVVLSPSSLRELGMADGFSNPGHSQHDRSSLTARFEDEINECVGAMRLQVRLVAGWCRRWTSAYKNVSPTLYGY